MAQDFSGTCQCGAVKYTVTGEAVNLFVCHCTQCQKQSASAFGMALWISNYEIRRQTGKLKSWSRTTDTGYEIVGEFCSACGTRIFHRHSANKRVLSIKPGTLENPPGLEPVAHIWTSEAQSWVTIPSDTLTYPEDPPAFDEMFLLWKESHGSYT